MSFSVPNLKPGAEAAGALYVPTGQGVSKWFFGDTYTMKATRSQTGGRLGIGEAIVPPGGGPTPHAHAYEDESFYVLEGELEFLDGDKTLVMGPGDFVYVPRGHKHRFTNITENNTKMLFFYTPGGPEELFVDAGDDVIAGEQPPQWDLERIQSVLPLAQRSGLVVFPDQD